MSSATSAEPGSQGPYPARMANKQPSKPNQKRAAGGAPAAPTPGQIRVHQIKQRVAPLLQASQFELAAALLEEVLPLDRRDPIMHKMLGFAYANMQMIDKGLVHLRRAVDLGVSDSETAVCLAGLYRDLGDTKGALRVVDGVLSGTPSDPKALRFKAWVLRSMGDSEGALDLIDRAQSAGAWSPELSITRAEILRKFKRYGEAVDELNAMLDDPRCRGGARRDCLFALGLTCDAMGEYDRAFEAIERANGMMEDKPLIPFDEFAAMWNKPDIDALPEAGPVPGVPDEKPIFVVGMPRSGTTLTEQILAAHSKISTVGESNAITTMLRDKFPKQLGGDVLGKIARDYFERIGAGKHRKADRIVDKMPENYYFLPAIRKALPRASVVHCTRDARDTCLSCFFQNFGERLPWTRRQETCARQYVIYRQIMDHWAEVLDLKIHESNYERLTSDPKPNVEQLLSHVGMPWDDACLAHHKQKSNVQTASVDQVRNPIYTTSQEKWRKYEKHLGPMLEILEGY